MSTASNLPAIAGIVALTGGPTNTISTVRVAFVVNGESSSPMGRRAQAFAARMTTPLEIRIFHRSRRKLRSLFSFVLKLFRYRPHVCYVFDMGYSGVGAGVLYRLIAGGNLLIDTGDAITELARSMGRGFLGVALTQLLEEVSLRAADRLVVRGTFHKEWLAQRGFKAVVIPDCVETELFDVLPDEELRNELHLDKVMTVGLLGSIEWSERRQTCYGWDLIEALRQLADLPIKGVLIGDGTGVPILQERCRRYGLEKRISFLGRLPYADLPRYLSILDVCLSTQTNDLAGQVRTTGKLPLYLAAGRFVLASRVGEARRVLSEDMLLDYRGQADVAYPQRLAQRLRDLVSNPELLKDGRHNVDVARAHFDYDRNAQKVASLLLQPRAQFSPVPRLAIVSDYPEENWPSMNLVAEKLLESVQQQESGKLEAVRVCPPFVQCVSRLPWLGRRTIADNADRLLNRFWCYPRYLKGHVNKFDYFHLCDHSYSQLVHVLPAERVGVFCHDLDTFRCLLNPNSERRPKWFRAMARRILSGFQKAAIVFHTTTAVGREIERHGLIDPRRLVQAPLGVAPEYSLEVQAGEPTPPNLQSTPFLLHVGSCIPRKRMNLLLDVFAAVRGKHPELRLVKVGGPWTVEQREQIDRLKLASSITQLMGVNRGVIANLYRTAAAVLLPSDAEGFGLPLVEALACGAITVASDLPTLREVGGEGAVYCQAGDRDDWVYCVSGLLSAPELAPPLSSRIRQSSQFTWATHAKIITNAYQNLLGKFVEPRPDQEGKLADAGEASEDVCAYSS